MSRNPNNYFIEQLRTAIQEGKYGNSALLPSERKLAADFNVGRSVVRNALKMLAADGVIALIPHRGACVTSNSNTRKFCRFIFCCRKISKVPSEMLSLLANVCMAAANERAEVLVSFSEGYDVLLDIAELAYRVQQGELQGVMILESCPPESLAELRKYSIPYVIINQEADYDVSCCRIDHRGIGRMAGARLLKTRYPYYGAITGNLSTLLFKEMLAGFRGALAEEEIALDKSLIFELLPTFSEESYHQLVEFLRQAPRPLALFAMRDVRAEFVYRACQELDLRIPEDVALIGYDNISWPDAAASGLTTIAQPIDKQASYAVKMLKKWYESGIEPLPTVLQGEIIERRSL